MFISVISPYFPYSIVVPLNFPFKGKEAKFLSGNQDRALWVLNQQCRKFGNKPEDLLAVLKAFKQYFDKGHVIFLKDLDSSVRFQKSLKNL